MVRTTAKVYHKSLEGIFEWLRRDAIYDEKIFICKTGLLFDSNPSEVLINRLRVIWVTYH